MSIELTHDRLHFDVDKYELETLEDERFLRIKMYLAHNKLSNNKSTMDIAVLKDAEDSLLNVPILAHIDEDDDDFDEHNMEYDEDTDEITYIEQPIGVVPSTNHDYHYEDIDGLTYAVSYGYIWAQYCKDAADIINRDKEIKLSIEIKILDSKYNPKTKILDIKKFKYTGVTLLGKKHGTGMKNAKAVLDTFSIKDNEQYSERVEELNSFLMRFANDSNNINNVDEDSVKDSEEFNNSNEEDYIVPKNKEEIAAQFKLTSMQLYSELSRVLEGYTYKAKNWYGDEVERHKYYLRDYDESFAYICDCEDKYLDKKVPFSATGDNISLNFDEAKRIKYSPTDWEDGDEEAPSMVQEFIEKFSNEASEKFTELKTKYDESLEGKETSILEIGKQFSELQEKFSSVETELNEKNTSITELTEQITQFKAKEDTEKTEEFLVEFASILTEQEMIEFKDKRSEYATFNEFSKEVKSLICDRIVTKVKETPSTFMAMPTNEEEENKDQKQSTLWERLRNNNKN